MHILPRLLEEAQLDIEDAEVFAASFSTFAIASANPSPSACALLWRYKSFR